MKKAACDDLIANVATDMLGPFGFQKQKEPRWIRISGHFFVEIGLPWSRGYYRMVTGIGCDLIPCAVGWKSPRRQKPGCLSRNFLFPDSNHWKQGEIRFSHDPLLDRFFSLEKVASLFTTARVAIEKTVRFPLTKEVFLDEFERMRRSPSHFPFYSSVDNAIIDYVLLRSQNENALAAEEQLTLVYKTDAWKSLLESAAAQLSKFDAQ